MINFIQGNIFDSKCEALVNPVNCVGVSGKGLALEFKERFPDNFKFYRKHCNSGNVTPGSILTFVHHSVPPIVILNFATKFHWKNPSQIEWIEEGLDEIQSMINDELISSLAMPPVGCGLGGLYWDEVKHLITYKLSPAKLIYNIPIEIYE